MRGYPLKGVEVKLPVNFQGIVFRENEQLKIEEAERELKFGGKFDSFTYWNYDRNPTENDAYKKLTHYLQTSEAVSWLLNDLNDLIKLTLTFNFSYTLKYSLWMMMKKRN